MAFHLGKEKLSPTMSLIGEDPFGRAAFVFTHVAFKRVSETLAISLVFLGSFSLTALSALSLYELYPLRLWYLISSFSISISPYRKLSPDFLIHVHIVARPSSLVLSFTFA